MNKFIKRLSIKPPSKKFWAREFLIMIILAVISTSVYFINEKRNSNIRSNIEKTEAELKVIQNKIDGFENHFFQHWILLKEYGAFEGNYESFKKEYGDYSMRNILFHLTENIKYLPYEENKTVFIRKMYTRDYHLDELYGNYSYTYRYSKKEFSMPEMSFLGFKKMLFSDEDFLKKNYLLYIRKNNYGWSIEKLKKTISRDTHIADPDKYFSLLPTLGDKQAELNKLKDSRLFYIESYIFIFILIVYGLRIFVSFIRWSIKQLS